jgi:hypothetical protein
VTLQERNRQPFFYALYDGRAETIDASGKATGEYVVRYKNPVQTSANISAAQGSSYDRMFGTDVVYDRVIHTADMLTKIDENTVLWIDIPVTIEPDGSTKTPWNYIVKRVAFSLNFVSFAIRRVEVSNA